jgi:hypothetical protein
MDYLMRSVPRRELVRVLLDIPAFVFKRIDRGEMYDLLQVIDWMHIDARATKPIAPYYDHVSKSGKKTRLHLPADQFKTVSGLEYALIDDLYRAFIKDMDTDIECQMIAIVLRPEGDTPDPAADPRVKLISKDQTREWLPMVRALPESIRTYMTTLISANRVFIHDTYEYWLFPESAAGDAADSGGLNFGWWGAYMDVAEDGTFGDYDNVLQTAFHTLCMYMSSKVDKARALKQQHDHAMARSQA